MAIIPTINLPTLLIPKNPTPADFNRVAPHFDLASGEFLFAPDGKPIIAQSREAFEQWCIKVCMTERGTRLCYSDKIGAEFEGAMNMPTQEAVMSAIIRTITETILIHPRARAVKHFQFSAEADMLKVSFEVEAIDFETRLEVRL